MSNWMNNHVPLLYVDVITEGNLRKKYIVKESVVIQIILIVILVLRNAPQFSDELFVLVE